MVRKFRPWIHRWPLPIAFVTLHLWLVFANIWSNSPGVDEPFHIASGLSHHREHNFRADQVNPPLARMISVLPLLPDPPAYDRTTISDEPGARSEGPLGFSWVKLNGSDVIQQTRLARLAGMGWSALGAWLLYRLVKRHRGSTAATMALALWCFDPTIIALAAVVTADLPAAVAALGAASAFDALLTAERSNVHWSKRLQAGLWLGIALSVKFTLLVLPIYWLVWGIGQRLGFSPAEGGKQSPLGRTVAAWLVVVVIAVVVVNAGYGAHGSCRRLEDYRFVSITFAGPLPREGGESSPSSWGNRFRGTLLGKLPIPLPEDFVLGIDVQRRDFEHRMPSYLNGHWTDHGWWWFYIYAIELKEPIPWLCLLAWAVIRLAVGFGSYPINEETAWLEGSGLTLFVFVSAQTGFSHHLRYVVPSYPFLFFFISRINGINRTGQSGLFAQDEENRENSDRSIWQTRI